MTAFVVIALAGLGINGAVIGCVWFPFACRSGATTPWGWWTCVFTVEAVTAALVPGWGPVAVTQGITALFCAWMWSRKRKDRKKAGGAIGAKSAALLAAIVSRMRETLQSRPGLQPVPAGAGFKIQISARRWR
jgi:hypothetical protein